MKFHLWSYVLLVAVFTAAISFQLFVPAPVGIANNGDFGKLIGRFSLGPENKQTTEEYKYITTLWSFDPANLWVSEVRSSELLPVSGAMLVGWLLSDHFFDLRIMGAIHAVIWIACFGALLPLLRPLEGWRYLAAAGAALFIFTDVSVVAYCNSFYQDTAAYLFLAWAVVLWLHLAQAPQRTGLFALFCVASVFCVSSKAQHAPLAIFLFALAAAAVITFEGWWRKTWTLALASAILLASCGAYLATAAFDKLQSEYAVVFIKILGRSADPSRDLRDLGLGPGYGRFVGYWPHPDQYDPMADNQWSADFLRQVNQSTIARFYLRHPVRALQIVARDLRTRASFRRPPNLGNYPASAGFPPGAQTSSFGWWSALRSAIFRVAWWHILIWYAALLAVTFRTVVHHRGTRAAQLALLCLMLAGMALTELAVSSLADEGETDRHLFLFHVITDFTLFAGLVFALRSSKIPSGARFPAVLF